MNLQPNTHYDITKLNKEQRLQLFLYLYSITPEKDRGDIEPYKKEALEGYNYKIIQVHSNMDWSPWTESTKILGVICATTLFLKFPRVVQVRDSEQEQWEERVAVFIDHKGRPYTYQAIREVEEIPEEVEDMMISWEYYREVPQKVNLTKQEIADKFNIDVELINII